MHEHMQLLLEHVLGKQPSSQAMPAIRDMVDDAERATKKLPEPKPGLGENKKKDE